MPTGPTDAAMSLATDEAGFPILDELARMGEWAS
jgi:hypothetical protein